MNKAVFLDRDGTINREVDHLRKMEDFEFLPNSIPALKILSDSEYRIIIITNQSGIARGYFDEKTLKEIHEEMLHEFSREGIRIDRIYYCPHHPDENCECRKPNSGMFKAAEKDFNLDLKNSYSIGDTTQDIEAGKRMGCKTILVRTGYAGKDGRYDVKADFIAMDLLQAVEIILG